MVFAIKDQIMRSKMQRILLAGAFFIAAMALQQRPAQANDSAPWCAVLSLGAGDVVWDCQYSSFEQCYPNVLAGNRGFCNHNPGYVGPMFSPRGHAKHHVKQR
jgi:hypothetical protein